MIVNRNFLIDFCVDQSADKSYAFCQISLKLEKGVLGNPDAWSVVGLVTGAIADMTRQLARQFCLGKNSQDYLAKLSGDDLFRSLYSWQWEAEDWPYEKECSLSGFNAVDFCALPLGSEIFDGDNAYLIFLADHSGRFVWRDYESGIIMEQSLDFDEYLNEWNVTKAKLERN